MRTVYLEEELAPRRTVRDGSVPVANLHQVDVVTVSKLVLSSAALGWFSKCCAYFSGLFVVYGFFIDLSFLFVLAFSVFLVLAISCLYFSPPSFPDIPLEVVLPSSSLPQHLLLPPLAASSGDDHHGQDQDGGEGDEGGHAAT